MIDYVYSPDYGGWYALEYSRIGNKTRVSKRIYSTTAKVREAIASGKHRWEKWS